MATILTWEDLPLAEAEDLVLPRAEQPLSLCIAWQVRTCKRENTACFLCKGQLSGANSNEKYVGSSRQLQKATNSNTKEADVGKLRDLP